MPKKAPSFEQLYRELEDTVQKLEAGNLTLDESMELYEQGIELARQCGEQLDRAELRITELSPLPVANEEAELYEENEEDA